MGDALNGGMWGLILAVAVPGTWQRVAVALAAFVTWVWWHRK